MRARSCFWAVSITFAIAILEPVHRSRAQDSDDVEIVHSSHGFQVARPKAWVDQQQPLSTPGAMMLNIAPKDAMGRVRVSVIARPIGNVSVSPTQARDGALQSTKGKNEFSNALLEEIEIAGRKAPSILIDWRTAGTLFRLRQCYLVEHDILYTLTFHSPADSFPALEPVFLRVRESFRFVPIDESARRKQTLERLAARCGSELDWATDWKSAAERAKAEHKAVMVVIRLQPGFDISDAVNIGPLMDPDIVALIRERCVPLRFRPGMQAPFVSHDVYGMSGSSFGSTVLVVTANGRVLGDTFTHEVTSFHDFLLESLAHHADSQVVAAPENLRDIELAEWKARRGELDEALAAISDMLTPQALRLRASILRRQRHGQLALEQLGQYRAAAGADAEPQASLDEAVVRLRMGQPDRAIEILERIVSEHTTSDCMPEALYWLGAVQLRRTQRSRAEETWTRLVDSHSENRWAWKAAAMLTSASFATSTGERLQWPSDETLAALKMRPFESVDVSELARAENEAIAYLLRNQRSDGSWISPSDGLGSVTHIVNPFTTAITAICARSLLAYRDRPEAGAAVKRAAGFLLGSRKLEKAADIKPYYMDYSVWSHAYTLSFLVACAQEGVIHRNALKPSIGDLIAELEQKQKQGGGWSYYVARTLAQADQPANQSISFMTAAVAIALLDARDAGFDVPKELIASSLSCLERMRRPNATFDYFLWHEREGQPGSVTAEGAAGRGPLCSLALYRGGRGSIDEIRGGLDIFLDHRASYSREKGKTLMHASPGGQGSHYLMFDYAWAAAAIAQLPDDARENYRTAILQQILDARSGEGSYLDNPINGWHYGTGMALSAFQILSPKGE